MSFVTDGTIPAGLGTQALLFGTLGNGTGTPSSTWDQVAWNVGGSIGNINASAYNQVAVWVKPVSGDLNSFQLVLQSGALGWMPGAQHSVPLSGGWQKIVYNNEASMTGGNAAANWGNIYSILVGEWNSNSGSNIGQVEFGGIQFYNVPEPSSWALFAFGALALGLTTWNRRKVVS
jgi:hypothetical protein